MRFSQTVGATAMLGCLVLLGPGPALAQSDGEDVPLIMLKPQGASTLSGSRLEQLYASIKKRAARAHGQVLPLTKTEVWTVPKGNVEDVRKAAARHGVVMSRLSATWNHVFQKASADTKVTDKQKSMMDRAKASLATIGVRMMAAPRPPMVEYALTKDANAQGPARDATSIQVAVNDTTTLTIRRTSVDVRSDMCVWRGVVEGTGAPATIMWWPGGKMTGTVQHEGKIYSIRHLGGETLAVVEMGEDRMPQEHAPMAQRARTNDPNAQDDPMVQHGDAGSMRPKATPVVARIPDPAEKKSGGGLAAKPEEIVIDVIVAYTKKAASNYSDIKRELIDLSVEEANEFVWRQHARKRQAAAGARLRD